jgi:beta-glucosidase
VLLKNAGNILPIASDVKRILVVGGFAGVGVPAGGGSSEVKPTNSQSVIVPFGGLGITGAGQNGRFLSTSPFLTLLSELKDAQLSFHSGMSAGDAALAAKSADMVIVFATRQQSEGFDSADLELTMGQNALISAIARANPNTAVVLQTSNPVTMPWASDVKAILSASYPGQEGAQAIADILSGKISPSGRLPWSYPVDESQLTFPVFPNAGVKDLTPISVHYHEGANVGYRWFAKRGTQPQFGFGHGLTYTSFGYGKLKVTKGAGSNFTAKVDVTNIGKRAGSDVIQIYLTSTVGQPVVRLVGFKRVDLKPGEKRVVNVSLEPRVIAQFFEEERIWKITKGSYVFHLGMSADKLSSSYDVVDLTEEIIHP